MSKQQGKSLWSILFTIYGTRVGVHLHNRRQEEMKVAKYTVNIDHFKFLSRVIYNEPQRKIKLSSYIGSNK